AEGVDVFKACKQRMLTKGSNQAAIVNHQTSVIAAGEQESEHDRCVWVVRLHKQRHVRQLRKQLSNARLANKTRPLIGCQVMCQNDTVELGEPARIWHIG